MSAGRKGSGHVKVVGEGARAPRAGRTSATELGEPVAAPMAEPLAGSVAEAVGEGAHRDEAAGAEGQEIAPGRFSDLFGRRLIYVAIWSAQIISAAVVSPILAYILGPTEFGLLASAIALHQLLSVAAIFGIDQSIPLQRLEEGGAAKARGLVFVGTVISFVVTGALGATSALWVNTLGFDNHLGLVVATFLWTGPGAAVQLMLALLLAEDRLGRFAFVSILAAVGGQVAGIGLAVAYRETSTVYAWGGIASQFGAMAVGWWYTRPAWRGLLERDVTRRALQLGAPLMISGLSGFVLNAADRVIIQRDIGSAQAGRYQIAYTVGYVATLLLTFTAQAWAPAITAIKEEAARNTFIGRSRDELYRVLIPLTLGVTLAAPTVLRIVAPASFRPSSLVLIVFLVAVSAYCVAATMATSRALIIARRGRPIAIATTISAVVNLALNIVFVPHYGLRAAAIATIVAFLVQAVIMRYALEASHRRATPRRLLATVTVVVGLALGSVYLPQDATWQGARILVGLLCLPWLVRSLQRARKVDLSEDGQESGAGAAVTPLGSD